MKKSHRTVILLTLLLISMSSLAFNLASAAADLNTNSAVDQAQVSSENGWSFDNPWDWGDFAVIDEDSAELVIGLKDTLNSCASQLKGLINKYAGKLIDAGSIGGHWAVLVDMPFEAVASFATETEATGLSSYIEPNFIYELTFEPNDSSWWRQYGPKQVEANWAWNNTAGYLTYPKNIRNASSSIATRYETQRKVFRNPRGQKYYYALFYEVDQNNYTLDLWKSSNGLQWKKETLIKNFTSDVYESADITFYEDENNSQLVVYFVYSDTNGKVYYRRGVVSDSSSNITLNNEQTVFSSNCHRPVVQIGIRNGSKYVWIVYSTKQGSMYYLKCVATNVTHPGATPGWSSPHQIASNYQFDYQFSVAPLSSINDVLVVWQRTVYAFGPVLEGRELSWNGSTFSSGTFDSASTGNSGPFISVVVNSSNVGQILYKGSTSYLKHSEWIVGTGFGSNTTVYSGSVDSLSLSIDLSSSPNRLYAFYVRQTGKVNYKVSTMGCSWSSEQTLDGDNMTLDYLSTSYKDWPADGKIQLIYTTQGSSKIVKFFEVSGYTPLVSVIDTGIDYDHPDLAANYVALGYDWVNNDTDPMDDHGHGTHCAGIIAAVLNNSMGVAGIAQVEIMAEKAFSSGGQGAYWDVACAINHSVSQGANILSMSFGGADKKLLRTAVKYAYNSGLLLVASAGNDASSNKRYPAAYDEVIAVTATDESEEPAFFTNFGDWVEVAAPGVHIYSTMWNDTYIYMSGTSMACPYVSGVAALIWSRFPLMRDDVRLHLRNTTDDLGEFGRDDYYG